MSKHNSNYAALFRISPGAVLSGTSPPAVTPSKYVIVDPSGHRHPARSLPSVTFQDLEYLQLLRPALLPCRKGYIYKLEKYLSYWFCRQWRFDQRIPQLETMGFSNEDPEIWSFNSSEYHSTAEELV